MKFTCFERQRFNKVNPRLVHFMLKSIISIQLISLLFNDLIGLHFKQMFLALTPPNYLTYLSIISSALVFILFCVDLFWLESIEQTMQQQQQQQAQKQQKTNRNQKWLPRKKPSSSTQPQTKSHASSRTLRKKLLVASTSISCVFYTAVLVNKYALGNQFWSSRIEPSSSVRAQSNSNHNKFKNFLFDILFGNRFDIFGIGFISLIVDACFHLALLILALFYAYLI